MRTAMIARDPKLENSGIVSRLAELDIHFGVVYVEGLDEPRMDVGHKRFEGVEEIMANIDYIQQHCGYGPTSYTL